MAPRRATQAAASAAAASAGLSLMDLPDELLLNIVRRRVAAAAADALVSICAP